MRLLILALQKRRSHSQFTSTLWLHYRRLGSNGENQFQIKLYRDHLCQLEHEPKNNSLFSFQKTFFSFFCYFNNTTKKRYLQHSGHLIPELQSLKQKQTKQANICVYGKVRHKKVKVPFPYKNNYWKHLNGIYKVL